MLPLMSLDRVLSALPAFDRYLHFARYHTLYAVHDRLYLTSFWM